MKIKKLLFSLAIILGLGLVFTLTGQFNAFEALDLRLYNALLHFKKDPPVNDKVILAVVDDIDIEKFGDWPWRRNILADSLIRLKEFDTRVAVFDIEYISPSLQSVASDAENKICNKIYEAEMLSEDLMRSIPKTLNQGYPRSELSNFTESLINENLFPMFSSLYEYVANNVSFDNDEYFGRACQFFGNTFLTVNNQDLGYSTFKQEDIDYIQQRFLTYNVQDEKKYILRDNEHTFKETYEGIGKGFTPALHSLISRANGVGFTNSNVDIDGTRRGMELFYDYDGIFLGQLVFSPLLNIFDTKECIRNKYELIVKNALFPGESTRRDIHIPLDKNGQMLINWQHEDYSDEKYFNGINYEHIYTINQLDFIEQNIFANLQLIQDQFVLFDEQGYPLDYVIESGNLLEKYQEILDFKNYLLEQCTGFDVNSKPLKGITEEEYSQYFGLRKSFFNDLTNFIQKNNIEVINQYLSKNHRVDLKTDFEELFKVIKEDSDGYNNLFAQLSNKFKDAYCIIGMTAASTTDIGAVPFNKQYANVGIHANIMNTILTESFITYKDWHWGLLASFIVALLGLTVLLLSNSLQNIINGVLKLAVIFTFIILFVAFDIYVPMAGGVIGFCLVDFLVGVFRRYLASSKEKQFITKIASSFANKDTVEELRKNPEAFKTEGQKKNITALFSDIQKFSTFSESMSKIFKEDGPNKLIAVLNDYLGQMSNEILQNQGNIDKYEGDAIISMFGAPDPMNTHTKEEWAYRCLDSAIKMKKIEERFNKEHSEIFHDYDVQTEEGIQKITLSPLKTRIGINSGEAFVGLMGSKTESFSKLNYTMIGDCVNLAARLEGVNKVYNCWILCSEDTWNWANSGENEGKIAVRALDKVRVVGRNTPVQLYNVIGFTDDLTEDMISELDTFNQAMSFYLEKDFKKAFNLFKQAYKIKQDPTSLFFAERCSGYIKKGVPENWDGVMNMTSK